MNEKISIEADADFRHTGGRAIGKNAGAKVKAQTVGRRRFITQCGEKYIRQTEGEDDLRHACVRYKTCMFQHDQERRT